MKIELLYDFPRLEEKLVIERLKSLNCDVVMTNVNNKPLLLGERIADVALIRVVSMFKALYSSAIRESSGATTINTPYTIMVCGDKVLTLSKVRKSGLVIPRSVIAMDTESAENAYRAFKKPFVDKPPIGSWGRLVTLVRDELSWSSLLEHRQMMPSQQLKVHVMQDYIESEKRDIRTIVIAGRVLGAVYRVSSGNEWRTNVALGGKTEVKKVDRELEETSIKAAEAVKGIFVAVDLLEGRDGILYVNEVNGVPEFKGFMEATGIDVAGELARYVVGEAKR